jgi:probable F420-dependent oxidoreductase
MGPPAQRPFRFAVQSFSAPTASAWRERARRAEGLGYSALHLADHVIGPGPALAGANHPVQDLAAVPAIAVAAEATTTLRVGCRVFCQDYRHPVVLAKEAATLDLLSEGRLELGLGAGWMRGEYEAMGLPFDPAPVRIARLEETVALLKAHFGGAPIDFAGRHFRVSGFSGVPLPVQRPLPLMIGGGGRRVLELAAREADVVSLNFNNRAGALGPDGARLSTAAETQRKVDWVRAAAGTRFPRLELEIGAYFTFVGPRAAAAAEGLGRALGLSRDEMLDHPHGLFGEVEALCDTLRARRERFGLHYVTVPDTALDAFAPVVAKLAGA